MIEIAYSIDRDLRVVQARFLLNIQSRTVFGWKTIASIRVGGNGHRSSRQQKVAVFLLETQYRANSSRS